MICSVLPPADGAELLAQASDARQEKAAATKKAKKLTREADALRAKTGRRNEVKRRYRGHADRLDKQADKLRQKAAAAAQQADQLEQEAAGLK